MTDIAKLQQERDGLWEALYEERMPARVPSEVQLTWDAAINYTGLDMKEAQYNDELYVEFYDKCCHDFPSDKAPVMRTRRVPLYYQILGSKAFVMSDKGNVQHPEVHFMEPSEYDEFIADPYAFMRDVLAPRMCTNLDKPPMEAAATLAKAILCNNESMAKMAAVGAHMNEKYGFSKYGYGGGTEAPLDLLADIIRSFTGISGDMRRYPDKVEAASNALIPICQRVACGPISSKYYRTFIPLHMAPFMNRKQFERFWWPQFVEVMKHIENCGAKAYLFCEQNWMDKIDYLKDLPDNTSLWFEFGDPKLVKDTLGDKHIITGFYPAALMQSASKQECIDELHKYMDILMPSGKYFFNFDKILYSMNDTIAENLKAIIAEVVEYGKY